ncbi:hypothetical protein A4G19_12120 [Pasteurellaceae bacterium Macca]|nr:hypothetical protein [Pasteurellaceae bacterium Macca]
MTNPNRQPQNPMDALKAWKANHRKNATKQPESDLTEKPSKDTRSRRKPHSKLNKGQNRQE